MKMIIKRLAVFMVLVVCCLLGMTQRTECTVKSGNDGNIAWRIDGDTLTIHAVEGSEGIMNAYSYIKKSPWQTSKAMKSVKHVVIEDGVKKLGALAFHGDNLHFKSMKIAGSVELIPDFFCHSIEIDTLYLGEGIKYIEPEAFYGVTKTIYVPKSVESFPMTAFGINDSSAKGIISYVETIYGYTESASHKYVQNYLAAIEASGKTLNMWSDGKKYSLDFNRDGKGDTKSEISFVALDQSSVFKKTKVSSKLSMPVHCTGKIKVTLPSYLSLVLDYSGMEGQVKATYKSGNKKIATVDKYGKISAKKKGTVKVVTTLKLKNGVSKKYTTIVTVK